MNPPYSILPMHGEKRHGVEVWFLNYKTFGCQRFVAKCGHFIDVYIKICFFSKEYNFVYFWCFSCPIRISLSIYFFEYYVNVPKMGTFCYFFKVLVNCGDPGSPLNGQKRGSRYWTGESIRFHCHPGYRLIGPATRLCLPSGNWSGIQPSCKWRNVRSCNHFLSLFYCTRVNFGLNK